MKTVLTAFFYGNTVEQDFLEYHFLEPVAVYIA